MVKFSSLLEYRKYIGNLPLDFIVEELIRVKHASKKDLLQPAPLLGLENNSEWSRVGKITFKLFKMGPLFFERRDDYTFRETRDEEKNLLLYCTYYHDVDDVWMIPFQVDVLYRVLLNAKTALKSLYYTPEHPLVKIRYPTKFYEDEILSQSLAGLEKNWLRNEVLAIRLLLDYLPSEGGGVKSQILKYGVLKQDAINNTEPHYAWDTELDYSYRYGKVTDWFTSTDSEPRWNRETFERMWLQGYVQGYQPFIYDQGYDLDILPEFTLLVDLPLSFGEFGERAAQYYLLFDPLQSATLNYPQGDFAII